MTAVAMSPELWPELDGELDALIDGTKTAETSYTAGKGMSLASIAVGSAVMRLSKVRSMAQSRDLQGTKTALDKASIKIREAAFSSSGDPEGSTLGANLDILAALVEVLKRMETPASGRATEDDRDAARTPAAAAVAKLKQRKQKDDGEGEGPGTARGQSGVAESRERGGLFQDLGIVEPDDNPMSCLVDEEDSAGGGRPKMRFLVAPVEPRLAEKEQKLYWGGLGGRYAAEESPLGSSEYSLAPTSLIGEGRRHARALQEALLHLQNPVDERTGTDEIPQQSPTASAPTESATATASLTFFKGGRKDAELEETGAKRQEKGEASTAIPEGSEYKGATPGPNLEMAETLRKQVRQASKNDYWPRLSLAYTLEEQGEHHATAGNFSASFSAYSEASGMFRECSMLLPAEPESLLRHWVTAQRASEVGHIEEPLELGVLESCIEICVGDGLVGARGAERDQGEPGSCENPVCYEAHIELIGALLARGQFERCTDVCGHILGKHDANDAEALFSLAQASEALGRFGEAREYAKKADALVVEASGGEHVRVNE